MTDIQSMANAIRFLALDSILNAGEGHQGVPSAWPKSPPRSTLAT